MCIVPGRQAIVSDEDDVELLRSLPLSCGIRSRNSFSIWLDLNIVIIMDHTERKESEAFNNPIRIKNRKYFERLCYLIEHDLIDLESVLKAVEQQSVRFPFVTKNREENWIKSQYLTNKNRDDKWRFIHSGNGYIALIDMVLSTQSGLGLTLQRMPLFNFRDPIRPASNSSRVSNIERGIAAELLFHLWLSAFAESGAYNPWNHWCSEFRNSALEILRTHILNDPRAHVQISLESLLHRLSPTCSAPFRSADDRLGYDFMVDSLDILTALQGEDAHRAIRIEVKASTLGENNGFYLSANEKQVSEDGSAGYKVALLHSFTQCKCHQVLSNILEFCCLSADEQRETRLRKAEEVAAFMNLVLIDLSSCNREEIRTVSEYRYTPRVRVDEVVGLRPGVGIRVGGGPYLPPQQIPISQQNYQRNDSYDQQSPHSLNPTTLPSQHWNRGPSIIIGSGSGTDANTAATTTNFRTAISMSNSQSAHSSTASIRRNTVCNNWRKYGICRFGDTCHFKNGHC